MTENNDSTPSPPAKPKSNGQFQKGLCPNPGGRPKGALGKTTKFLQIMTQGRQKRALKILDQVFRDAEKGDPDSRKLVVTILQPFLKREAEKEGGGGGDRRPMVNVIVNQTEGHKSLPPAVRVIDAK